MDLRKVGIALIFIGIVVTIVFIGDDKIFVPALTVTVLGFFITVVGFVDEIRKRKIINDKLDEDIGTVLQPLITKYSNLNKQYRSEYSGDEYVQKRIQLNKDLESREIKKIVIEFSKEQDKLI